MLGETYDRLLAGQAVMNPDNPLHLPDDHQWHPIGNESHYRMDDYFDTNHTFSLCARVAPPARPPCRASARHGRRAAAHQAAACGAAGSGLQPGAALRRAARARFGGGGPSQLAVQLRQSKHLPIPAGLAYASTSNDDLAGGGGTTAGSESGAGSGGSSARAAWVSAASGGVGAGGDRAAGRDADAAAGALAAGQQAAAGSASGSSPASASTQAAPVVTAAGASR